MQLHKISGIIRYASVVEASGPAGYDRKYYGVTLLLHKDDPQLLTLKKIVEETIANENTGFKALSKKPDFTMPFEPCNEAEGPLVEYYQVRIRTNAVGKDGIPKKRPQTHILNEASRQTTIATDPEFDQDCIGRIANVAFNVGTWAENKGGVCFYYYCGLISDSKVGNLNPEDLRKKTGVSDLFAEEISAVAPVTTEAVFEAIIDNKFEMTPAAKMTYDQYKAAGWSDAKLISHGLMTPPNGVVPSFL